MIVHKAFIVIEVMILIALSSEKFNINVLSYHQYQCSILSTKESLKEDKKKTLDVSIKCKSHFKVKDMDLSLSYIIDDSIEKSEDSFLNHLFYVNERGSKICIECLLLDEQKKENFEVIGEDNNSIHVERKNTYKISAEEAQLIKVVRVNVMEQQTFENDWNNTILINKHSILKVLSQIIFAYFIVLYEF
ncbi:MAG: hypothetical protein MJ252_20265 [archaeon]|nr:hypothetical protein [archaeon]